jgi:hypothetical protein
MVSLYLSANAGRAGNISEALNRHADQILLMAQLPNIYCYYWNYTSASTVSNTILNRIHVFVASRASRRASARAQCSDNPRRTLLRRSMA